LTRIRFHLDEHVANAIAEGLRHQGIDLTTTVEAGLLSAEDPRHVDFALAESRVIYTNDADFLALHHQGVAHAGIAFCKPSCRTIREVVEALALIHNCLSAEDMVGRVEYI
jgi:predicted nuclease of predicted toxin-antitoxin system